MQTFWQYEIVYGERRKNQVIDKIVARYTRDTPSFLCNIREKKKNKQNEKPNNLKSVNFFLTFWFEDMKLRFLPAACHFECDHFLLNHIAVWSLGCLCKLPHVANFKLLENWMSCKHLKAPPNYLTCIRTNILIKRVSFSSLQIYTCIFGTLTFYLVEEEKKHQQEQQKQ